MTLLTKIFEVTFPDGFGPFVEKLRPLGLHGRRRSRRVWIGSGYELAKAAESLASDGGYGGIDIVLKMTPRKISALVQLKERRLMGEQADLMRALRNAQAEDKVFRKIVKKLDDESQ